MDASVGNRLTKIHIDYSNESIFRIGCTIEAKADDFEMNVGREPYEVLGVKDACIKEI